MSLRDMAFRVLNRGTVRGTEGGTARPTDSELPQSHGTVENGFNTGIVGESINCPTVPGTGCGTLGHYQESGTPRGKEGGTPAPDPFLAGHHILVHLEPVGDIWLVSDEQVANQFASYGLPALLEDEIRGILQVESHKARLERLIEIFGRRHPLTQTTLDIFPGSRVTSIMGIKSW